MVNVNCQKCNVLIHGNAKSNRSKNGFKSSSTVKSKRRIVINKNECIKLDQSEDELITELESEPKEEAIPQDEEDYIDISNKDISISGRFNFVKRLTATSEMKTKDTNTKSKTIKKVLCKYISERKMENNKEVVPYVNSKSLINERRTPKPSASRKARLIKNCDKSEEKNSRIYKLRQSMEIIKGRKIFPLNSNPMIKPQKYEINFEGLRNIKISEICRTKALANKSSYKSEHQ